MKHYENARVALITYRRTVPVKSGPTAYSAGRLDTETTSWADRWRIQTKELRVREESVNQTGANTGADQSRTHIEVTWVCDMLIGVSQRESRFSFDPLLSAGAQHAQALPQSLGPSLEQMEHQTLARGVLQNQVKSFPFMSVRDARHSHIWRKRLKFRRFSI